MLPYNAIEVPETDKQRLTEFARQIEDSTHLNVLIDPFASDKELVRAAA